MNKTHHSKSPLEQALVVLAAVAIIVGVIVVVHLVNKSQSCSHSSYQQYLHSTFPDATPAPSSNPC